MDVDIPLDDIAAGAEEEPDVDELGFVDWSARRKLPSIAQQALRKVDDEAAAARHGAWLDTALKTLRCTKAAQESKLVSLQQLIEGYHEDWRTGGPN